jgi:hypothetical protein
MLLLGTVDEMEILQKCVMLSDVLLSDVLLSGVMLSGVLLAIRCIAMLLLSRSLPHVPEQRTYKFNV